MDFNTRNLLHLINHKYGLGKITLIRDLGGWGNSIRWLLVDSHSRYYFLKEKVYTLKQRDFPLHLNLHFHIYMMNGPVPKIYKTTKETLFVNFHGKFFELQEWISGCPVKYQCQYGEYLGYSIVDFLYKAANFNNPTRENWLTPSLRERYFPDQPHSIYTYIRNALTSEKSNLFPIKEQVFYLNFLVDRYLSKITWDNLPTQFIHGDLSRDNSIYKDERILFIDLDDARWSYRLWDIVNALVNFSLILPKKNNNKINLRKNWNYRNFWSVLDPILAANILTKDEIKNLESMLAIASIVHIIAEFDFDDPDPYPVPLNQVLEKAIHYMHSIHKII